MGDYPDYTDVMHIIGSDIMVPIDVQASYIMMPVDIQAQYLTLDINIKAQTVGNIAIDIAAQTIGNLAVNIAASSITLNVAIQSSAVTLNVDITAQTIGNINMDIEAQSVGVYVERDWATKQDNDKSLVGASSIAGSGDEYLIDYTVPTGKVLYVDELAFSGEHQWESYLEIAGTTIHRILNTAATPYQTTFTTPKKAEAGEHVKVRTYNQGASSGDFQANLGCREYTV